MRSALIERIRKAAPVIFSLPSGIFKPTYKRQSVSELVELLKFDPNSGRNSSLPPILYPPAVRRKGRRGFETKLFQSPEVFQVSQCMEQRVLTQTDTSRSLVIAGCAIRSGLAGLIGKTWWSSNVWQTVEDSVIGGSPLLHDSIVFGSGKFESYFLLSAHSHRSLGCP